MLMLFRHHSERHFKNLQSVDVEGSLTRADVAVPSVHQTAPNLLLLDRRAYMHPHSAAITNVQLYRRARRTIPNENSRELSLLGLFL